MTWLICGMHISRPAYIGSTAEAPKGRKNRNSFAFKKFILPHCLDSAIPPRPNERDPNSRAVKIYRKEGKKRRKKGRERGKIGDLIAKKKKKKKKSVHIDFSVVTPAP